MDHITPPLGPPSGHPGGHRGPRKRQPVVLLFFLLLAAAIAAAVIAAPYIESAFKPDPEPEQTIGVVVVTCEAWDTHCITP